jgi:hypothetical protein
MGLPRGLVRHGATASYPVVRRYAPKQVETSSGSQQARQQASMLSFFLLNIELKQ